MSSGTPPDPQKLYAEILAKSIDLHLENQDDLAWDLIASRLRALIHVNRTGSWAVAESLQSAQGRDTGLSSAADLYRARKEAQLVKGENAEGLQDDSGHETSQPKNRKRKGKKGRKKGPGAAKEEGQ